MQLLSLSYLSSRELCFPTGFFPLADEVLALGGGLTMVFWGDLLNAFGQGPVFDVERVIIMEPLLLLFGLMLTDSNET